MTPNGQQLTSYGYQNMAGLLTRGNLNMTFQHKSGFWQKNFHDLPKTLYMKNAVNELSFTPVTHTAYSDTWFYR
jgi:hypothetical protein